MPEIKNIFSAGRMNQDYDSRLIPKGEYPSATNIKVSKSSGSDVGALENSLSNKKLTNLSLGTNVETIGMYFDTTDDKIYWFVVSDSGSYVIEHHEETNTTSIVLEDTSAGVLNFSTSNLITGVNLIPDSDNNVRLLCWTDNLNPPRCINVTRAKGYGANNFNEAHVSLIKAPPLNPPIINLSATPIDGKENNIEKRFLRFAYQYQYLDGEYTSFSAFTDTAFLPKAFQFDFSAIYNKSMINLYNRVDIEFNTGTNLVKNVRVVFKESGSNTVYLIEDFNKDDEGWSDNLKVNLAFDNSKVYQALPEDQLFRIFDAVPLLAKSQEVIGNRLVFGNYTEGYDIEDCVGVKLPTVFTLEKETTAIVEGVATQSLHSNRDYEIGIVYSDDRGRMSTVLTSTTNTIYFPNSDSINQNQIKAIIKMKAPCWANKYRFFIKQSRVDYDIIVPTVFYQDGAEVWVKLEGNDVNKISEGDFLYVKADTKSILSDVIQTKVLEIKQQDMNFLEPPDTSIITEIQKAGTYFKIIPDGFSININDYSSYHFSGYDDTEPVNLIPIHIASNINVVEKAVYYGSGGQNDLTSGAPYTGLTDIRYIVEIVATPGTDTFRWSDDDGASWAPTVNVTTGAPIVLSNSVEISFGATTGHSLTDSWIVSAKSTSDNGYNTNTDTKAYVTVKSLPSNGFINIDDIIPAGTIIEMFYIEYGQVDERIQIRKVASKQYDNLEEWFYGDNIISDLGISDNRVWFRRGTTSLIGNAKRFEQDPTGDMCMIMLSSGTETSKTVKATNDLTILTSENTPLFETIPLNDDSQFFFEIGRTYEIDASFHHLGYDAGDVDQTSLSGGNAEIILPAFNCFAWGNAFESYKIQDSFTGRSMKTDSRPLNTVDDYRKNVRIASLTYSKPYEQTTNYNGLNEFNLSNANWKDMDDKYESIQKLYSENTDLIVFQEDKVHRILFQKDVLFDADGSGNIRESSKVLGQEVGYAGEFGISKEPESFAFYGNDKYFTDSQRGAVLRLGADGITEISKSGMTDFFRDKFIDTKGGKKVGGYDLFNKQYVLFVDNAVSGTPPIVVGGATVKAFESSGAVIFTSKVVASTGDVIVNYVVDTGTVNIVINEEGVDADLGNVSGSGSVSYTRTDNTVTSLTVTVTPITTEPSYSLTIPEPVDLLAPVSAAADVLDIFRNKSDDVNVLFNDTFVNPVTVTITIPPVKGAAVVNGNKTINYVHGNADLLPDVFTYQIDDGTTTDTNTVDITILTDISGGVNGLAFNISSDSFYSYEGSGEGASGFDVDLVKYHDGLGVYPIIGDTIYTDITKLLPFIGVSRSSKWYKMDGGKAISINGSGVVDDLWIFGISTI